MSVTKMDAYDYSDALKDLLIKENTVVPISQEFKGLPTNAQKIRFNYELLKERNLLPKLATLKETKNVETSNLSRTKGNKFYEKHDYIRALECYNESLCYAPENSEVYATALANRAAVYRETGFFKICLENIEAALKIKVSEKLSSKWKQRQKDCLNAMKTFEDSFDLYEAQGPDASISLEANSRMPFAANCLEYASDPQYGRFVRTKVDLAPGDVVILEEPFAKILLKHSVYSQCANCGFNHYYNLTPSPLSTTVMYCSDACKEESWKRYYKYEHPVDNGIFELFTKISMISIRLTLKTFTMLPNLNGLKEFLESIDEETENAFSIDYTTASEQDKFKAIYALETNENDRSVADFFQRTNLCAIAWYIFKEFTSMKEVFENNTELEDIFLDLLMRFNQAAAVNYHCIGEVMRKSEGADALLAPFTPKDFGSGAFALCSLINHSCSPNVVRFCVASKNAVLVIRPIKVNGQLFDNYGPHHCIESLYQRKQSLKDQYRFDCLCDACTNDYVSINELPTLNLIQIDLVEETDKLRADTKYDNETRNLAKKLYPKITKFLKDADRYYPCFDISKMQENLFVCSHILFFPRPLDLLFVPYKKRNM